MDYDGLKAGRELDALVAEKVMGWEREENRHEEEIDSDGTIVPGFTFIRLLGPELVFSWGIHRMKAYIGFIPDGSSDLIMTDSEADLDELPYYSTDIAAAWQVVERLCEMFWERTPYLFVGRRFSQGPWLCKVDDASVSAYADTAPLAICRAALKAVHV